MTIIVALGALARLAAAFYLGNQVVPTPGTAYDQIYYQDMALNLLAGKGFVFSLPPWPFIEAGQPTAYAPFIYPLVLAGVYAIVGPNAVVARVLQALVCSLMPVQVYRLTRTILDESPTWADRARSVAIASAAIAAAYAYFIYYSATLLTEGLYLLAVVWSLELTLKLAEQPSLRRWALWGLAVAGASMLRQTFMAMALLLFVYVVVQAFRRLRIAHIALAAAIAAALILPWTVRNYVVFDRFLLLNSQAGQVLWNANHPGQGTRFTNQMFPIPDDLRGANEVDLSNELMRRALANIMAAPGRIALLSLDRARVFFMFWPTGWSPGISNLSRVASWGLCLPFMIGGVVLSLREWRRWLLLNLFVAAHAGIHLISWTQIRYRMPIDVALVPLAGVVAFISWVAGRRRTADDRRRRPRTVGGHG